MALMKEGIACWCLVSVTLIARSIHLPVGKECQSRINSIIALLKEEGSDSANLHSKGTLGRPSWKVWVWVCVCTL
jgi:hypothetical protein